MLESKRLTRRKLTESFLYQDEMTAQELRKKVNEDPAFTTRAVITVGCLTDEELDEVLRIWGSELEDVPYLTDINDFFENEAETIAKWLGYDAFKDIMKRGYSK